MNSSTPRPPGRHIDFLDPLRGIAIFLVFLYHCLGLAFGSDRLPCGRWLSTLNVSRSFLPLIPVTFGWAGVSLFFVISGFCIHLSFSRHPQWSTFFARRFFRIYPPYLVVLLLLAFVYPVTRLKFPSGEDLAQLLSHLTLTYNTSPRWVFGLNPSLWSIAVEAQLYLLYPILLFLAVRFGWWRTLLSVCAIEAAQRLFYGLLWTFTSSSVPRLVTDSPFFFWGSWSVGAWVAERHLRGQTSFVSRSTIYAAGALAIAASLIKPLSGLSFLLFAIMTGLLITKLLTQPDQALPIPRRLGTHFQKVGLCSFSLYLVHQPLLMGIPHLLGQMTSGSYIHPLVMFSVCVASWFLMVPIAQGFYQFIELPSIALGKRFLTSRPVSQPV